MQLHREFANDGLVLMSLDVAPDEWDEKNKVLKFLTDKKADFPNFILFDKEQVIDAWIEKNDIFPTPNMLAFDRSGRPVPVPRFKGKTVEEKAEQERAFVKKLLEQK